MILNNTDVGEGFLLKLGTPKRIGIFGKSFYKIARIQNGSIYKIRGFVNRFF